MGKVFFTADLHFGHANIIKTCNRPFNSVEDMDEALIKNWNRRVGQNDTVYILGDFMFRAKNPPEYYLRQLRGRKHLLIGNHDQWIKKCDLSAFFISVHDEWHTSDGQHAISLNHYPMMSWPHENRAYMVFGHLHNAMTGDKIEYICKQERMLNAGVEINHYEPVTFDKLLENNRLFKENILIDLVEKKVLDDNFEAFKTLAKS